MAVAVVAARLRSVLIDAAAAYRQGDEFEVLNQLVRVAGVLDRFPLPDRSPQADMIATAVQQRATLQERQVCGWPLRVLLLCTHRTDVSRSAVWKLQGSVACYHSEMW